ncbi:checkpoint protein Hus1/Mec3 [Lipomyces arxii]|uniref:checkpoint protein Hus1/Mec3 n=1 Tax=Lipomyces arxii TaxID=56418 RepID=UPI0034CEADB5
MRLNTQIDQPDILREIAYAISYVRKYCLITFDNGMMSIVSHDDAQIWTHLNMNDILSNTQISSLDKNVINLEMNVELLARALKSVSSAGVLKMRLAKKQSIPHLVISAEHASRSGHTTKIAQEIPVKVIRQHSIVTAHEPDFGQISVGVELPRQYANVLKICERYRTLGSRITVSASRAGELRMAVRNDDVYVETTWANLNVVHMETDEAQDSESQSIDSFYNVQVDAKELSGVLRIHSAASRIVLGIYEDHMLTINVALAGLENGNYMNCYLPNRMN